MLSVFTLCFFSVDDEEKHAVKDDGGGGAVQSTKLGPRLRQLLTHFALSNTVIPKDGQMLFPQPSPSCFSASLHLFSPLLSFLSSRLLSSLVLSSPERELSRVDAGCVVTHVCR